MAGARSRLHKPADGGVSATTRRSTRASRRKVTEDVPGVFDDIISEVESAEAKHDEDSRPLKRRRVANNLSSSTSDIRRVSNTTGVTTAEALPSLNQQSPANAASSAALNRDGQSARVLQTVEDSSESDDSDMEWEDALVADDHDEDSANEAEPDVEDISITIGGSKGIEETAAKKTRRRGMTSVDKKRRLDIHKMHILCLLYHAHRRNAWCSDGNVHAKLRQLPSPKILSNLIPNPELSQYQASRRFIDGMQEMKALWSARFSVTAQGIHKPRWHDADGEAQAFSAFDEQDLPMDKQDFRKAATRLQGSQDVGAQLFCALLRSIGIEARLVCSLQCLPFASMAQGSTPQKESGHKNAIHLDPYNSTSPLKAAKATPTRPKRLSRLERVLGERNPALSSGVAPKQKKRYHAAYPVYWVEVLNPSYQKWVPIDPLSTYTVDKPEKLEPPLNSSQNSLTYAVAFEEDSTARDVTRRYAKAYNAKTRKCRVDCTESGAQWWRKALKMFRRHGALDRDQVEDAALARKEGQEGIPKNVQDFKGHPIYVLERHLRHNEVIHPKKDVGKVNVGSAMNPRMEQIYRRKDVHVVRSADKWYRLGRDVKLGEQPLKHAKPKKSARSSVPPDMELDEQQDEVGAALYAIFQTELYIPPPVVRGRVPRNAYGNLDLYVSSMVPKGGVHIRHKLAAKAARIVGVDYAEAVTGFSFKGRHGTAIVQGVVVAEEYADAVGAVLDAIEYAQEEAENSARRSEVLRLWRRFYLGLRITERINAIEIDGETKQRVDVQEEIEAEDKALQGEQMAGGFFMDEAQFAEPTARKKKILDDTEEIWDEGFIPERNEGDGRGVIPEEIHNSHDSVRNEFGSNLLSQQELRRSTNEDLGGGFVSGEDEDQAGGFMRDPSPVLPIRQPAQFDGAAENSRGGFRPEIEQMHEPETQRSHHTPTPSKDSARGIANVNAVNLERGAVQEGEHDNNIDDEKSTQEVHPMQEQQQEGDLASGSPSEAGSLPLEDPEDEDADPDWLVDIT